MAFQFLLNLLLAFTWMFLTNSWTFTSYFIGYVIGMILLFGMRRFFSHRFYMKNIVAIIKLLVIFIKELALSNLSVLKMVLSPKMNIQPGIFALKTELKKDWEITVLANLITLTPGTLVLEISEDNKILYVHALHLPDVTEAIFSIKNSFEKAIMEVSR